VRYSQVAWALGALGVALVVLAVWAARQGPGRTQPSPAESVSPAVLSEWGLAGEGGTLTDRFTLPAGHTVFDVTYTGSGPFRAQLLTAAGPRAALLAEGSGPTQAQLGIDLAAPSQYAVRIEAAGAWEITVLSTADASVETRR
jgi:hypothetical protein